MATAAEGAPQRLASLAHNSRNFAGKSQAVSAVRLYAADLIELIDN